jgi:hypothetical protein
VGLLKIGSMAVELVERGEQWDTEWPDRATMVMELQQGIRYTLYF